MSELSELLARVRHLEDVEAVRRVLIRYGIAVDAGDAEATAALYTPDCVIDIDDGAVVFEGHEGVRALVGSAAHQEILSRCVHLIGPAVVDIDGDVAQSTAYALVVLADPEDSKIWRVGVNRLELHRRGERWLIHHRWSAAADSETGRTILRTAAQARSLTPP